MLPKLHRVCSTDTLASNPFLWYRLHGIAVYAAYPIDSSLLLRTLP